METADATDLNAIQMSETEDIKADQYSLSALTLIQDIQNVRNCFLNTYQGKSTSKWPGKSSYICYFA